jgi:hypothetical protein
MFDTSHIEACEYVDGDAFENLQIPGEVTYVKTDHVRAALESHSFGSKTLRGILLTHNSDLGIGTELISLAFGPGSGIHAWFGQNVLVRHPRLTAIPIGLERTRWFPSLRKRDLLHDFAKRSPGEPDSLCLANFSVSTNGAERAACADNASSFATMQVAGTVCQDAYERYLMEILRHKFVLCPNGNGVDTHRLWETLYLGRIPVVTRSPTMEAFASLPMVILDSWGDLTRAGLEDYWRSFRAGQIDYILDALFMSYWRDRIVTESARVRDQRCLMAKEYR